ncbi:hypothetical protein [Lysobacter silvisoli]|uniref:Chemotaxis protein n=1 Tax=Lysobacter silvisoli TaxID=2293254 RepID=A0A371JYC6_9GAMM|nr:hypothetical protein [Lysobacter silvisoli]RDZ26620.1 hypothetical protein DX914_16700 [Lysobacter silvisoli]
MAAWFTVVAPLIPEILRQARPYFTKAPQQALPPANIVAVQIGELQDAAAQNAESIKILAAEMQKTLTGLQEASMALEQRLRRARAVSLAALATAGVALAIAAAALALR